ncbi:MAG: stalk domain-containing protein, partial [Candidatus Bathyarchaeia archaeon]
SMDITGDGTWYNTDAKYTAVDNGDGTYTIQLTPPPSVFGYAYPNKIRIALRMDYDSQRCRLVGYVDIPVKLPTFETTITTACGDTFANDNLITEGFAEKITLTKLVDPRNGKDLTSFVTQFKAYSSTTCYIPTAWVDQQSCAGCNSLTISVLALDNPNVEAKPTVRLRVHMNGVRVRLYGAELTVTSPKISVTPNKDIPFTEPGKPITMLTFTATDAHGKPMCGVTFGIYDINTMNSYYTLSGQASSVSPNYCEPELSGKPFIPVLPAQEIYTLNIGSSFNYHTGTTGSDGTLVYPFTPGTGGRYAAMAISDIGQIGAPKAVLDAFMAKMKLILETVYKAPEVDKEAPKVTVSAPDKVTTATVKVTGKATDNVGVVSVWIGAKQASLAPDGTFEAVLDLVPGDNTFTVSAYDAAGNVGTATLKVSYVVPQVTKIVLKIGSDIMTVNGKVVQLDAAPEIKDGRTFLPLRAIAEAFGAQVTWVPETQGITVVLG